ncbi:MAG TPA: nitroreductase [Rhizomicrobium sp.]|nr:nitroreductase [Rhizomicrobium sp.]
MNVTEAVRSRHSIRAFLDKPVPEATLREVLETAARAASGGNLQPWRIYAASGAPLADFKAKMAERLKTNPSPDPLEYHVYPQDLWEPHRTWRFRVGEQMYGLVGISREHKAERLRWFQHNYEFFHAPAAIFAYLDKRMGPPQWSDMGMYLQTVMLLLREKGLDSCAQECWSIYNGMVREFVKPPPELMLFCGMAIGYRDDSAPVNKLVTERAPLDEFASFVGF